uniref:Ciliary microtubule inner protein 2B n=1 Tax=Xenopus laevis TaxID=8355 RepID=B7ZSG4_XENLA|nr:Unknown (protein for MGC:197241) [Xenopus laevis]
MAVTFPPKISPTLMTPDPHFIPGYSGFCPQYRYSLGKTYGQLTSHLLTNPDIRRSGHLVLQSNPFPPAPRGHSYNESSQELGGRRRRQRLGDPKLTISMIPGYTGFIPRSQKFFAKTYAETSRDALSDFHNEQQTQESQRQEMLLTSKLQEGRQPQTEHEKQLLTARHRTPLPALSKEPAPFMSLRGFQPQGSPYYMEEENPNKYFISGYTGYVPRSRFLIGNGYPITTNRAMVEFAHMNQKKGVRFSDQQGHNEGGNLHTEQGQIYLEELGLLPRYTGYVPGYKFQFGNTFGRLTQNALGQSTLQKQTVN